MPGGKVRLANLIAYSDQSRIHDCLAEGVVDAFAVDKPIYHWACTNPESPWYGKIEICSNNIPDVPYYYSVGVRAAAETYTLLKEVNSFIGWYLKTAERDSQEVHWQGNPVSHTINYRDEAGNLPGEEDLRMLWEASNLHMESVREVA